MAKKIIQVSVATLGLAALVWAINEAVISRLQKKALEYDLEAITTKNLYKFLLLKEHGEKFTRQTDFAKKIQSFNPWSYIIPYAKRLYFRYFAKDYKEAKQY